jgi:phosphoserine aminotransferase
MATKSVTTKFVKIICIDLYDLLSISSETNILMVQGGQTNSIHAIGFNNSGKASTIMNDLTYSIYHHSKIEC